MQEKYIFILEPLKVIGWLNSSLLKLVAKPIPDHISVNKRRKDKIKIAPIFIPRRESCLIQHNTYIFNIIVTTKLVFFTTFSFKVKLKGLLIKSFFCVQNHSSTLLPLLVSVHLPILKYFLHRIVFLVMAAFLFSFSLHRFLLRFC